METLANLESFVRSAELGSFSAAARLLALTPAAVSRNVAMLERNLGVRLFQRSTRKLALTESGERFLEAIRDNLEGLQDAIADTTASRGEPAGTLKISTVPHFGIHYLLPLLPEFLARYPGIRLDWEFDNTLVDLIGRGFDAAISSGIDLSSRLVARTLAPTHVVAVAAPSYLENIDGLQSPEQLASMDGLMLRSAQSGRVHNRVMRTAAGQEAAVFLRERLVFNEPEALCQAAELGMGIALAPLSHALAGLHRGSLVRVLPRWYVDAGTISLYYPHRKLLPAKTRCFVDHVLEACERSQLAQRLSAF